MRISPHLLLHAIAKTLLLGAFLLLGACNRSNESPALPAPADYQYGTVISFGQGGNSASYQTFGWCKTEAQFTWTEGQSAGLAMTVKPAARPLSLKMKLAALVKPPELPFQPVEVNVNNRKVADWQVAETAEFSAPLPQDLVSQGGVLQITLSIPKANSPKALGLGNDTRMLGLSCHSFQLD